MIEAGIRREIPPAGTCSGKSALETNIESKRIGCQPEPARGSYEGTRVRYFGRTRKRDRQKKFKVSSSGAFRPSTARQQLERTVRPNQGVLRPKPTGAKGLQRG